MKTIIQHAGAAPALNRSLGYAGVFVLKEEKNGERDFSVQVLPLP